MGTYQIMQELKELKKRRFYERLVYKQESQEMPIHQIENNERIIERTNLVIPQQQSRFNPVANIDNNPIIRNIIQNKNKVSKN